MTKDRKNMRPRRHRGHAPPESLDGIIKITKPGGIIIFSLSKIAYDDHGLGIKMAQMDDTSAWEFLDRSRLFRTYPFSEKEEYIRHWVCAYRKL